MFVFHFLHKLGVAFLLFIGLLAWLGWWLAPQDELLPVDAIVAISGDQGFRYEKALELYEEGWSDVLIFSGAAFDPGSPSNAQVMKRQAIAQGVLPKNIFIEEISRDTEENAAEVAKIVRTEGIRSIILVTSPYHQRRAHLEFDRALPENVVVLNYSARDDNWRRSRWWISPRGWYLTLSEGAKIALSFTQNAITP